MYRRRDSFLGINMSSTIIEDIDFEKHSFRPSEWPRKLKLLKTVNCQNCQKTVLSQLEKVGGHRYPSGSLPQGDIKTRGNHVNVEEIYIEFQNNDYSSPLNLHHRGFHSAPRKYLIPKINMRKFDGKYPITWIF
jgi:copper chaperone CopZ